ncbi:hypothetical protein FACS189432_09040 [Bacteroidia bacterium]|nr:hypothetical protein FACS189426_09430 [Bacteroidia bacterium]GHT29822.1 hypothetical protein FACS189432_09040 [Bacteroidia bacterium]GHV70841.1 hypothetical protein FACS189420_3610 [Bacteroidia bacterium]
MEQKKESARQTVVEAPETYVAPAIEIIEVEVEKGFAQSGDDGGGDSEPAPTGRREIW